MKSAYVCEAPSWRLPDGACGGRPLHFFLVLFSHAQAIGWASVTKSIPMGSETILSRLDQEVYLVLTVAAVYTAVARRGL